MTDIFLTELIILIFSAIIAVAKGWLTKAGGLAMVLIGVIIELAFGLPGIIAIFLFFITANLVGRVPSKRNPKNQSDSEPRDIYQVIANGGVPFIVAIGALIHPSTFWIGAFLATLAEANADTWASEVGSRFGRDPYHLTLRKRVAPGVSGAVTWVGTFAALMGSGVIALFGALVWDPRSTGLFTLLFVLITLIGWLGQGLDTLLGGVLQARYLCPICGNFTDHTSHCSVPTKRISGFSWATNNVINLLSTFLTGVLGGLILFLALGKI